MTRSQLEKKNGRHLEFSNGQLGIFDQKH